MSFDVSPVRSNYSSAGYDDVFVITAPGVFMSCSDEIQQVSVGGELVDLLPGAEVVVVESIPE